jgi:RimJ/RimL family protein N-acetyltransferase
MNRMSIGSWQDAWPLARLQFVSGDLTLRLGCEDDAVRMVAASESIVPSGREYWLPWLENRAAETSQRVVSFLNHVWSARAELKPESWSLNFVVLHDGVPIGVQGLHTVLFAQSRVARTGSWLSQGRHGQGIGTRMRAMVLGLAFDHLEARYAMSSYAHDNEASAAVSR